MPIVRVKGLRREDYAQAPAWFDALLFTLNQALGDIAGILNGGVTFAENHLAELRTVEVTMPAEFPTWRVVGAAGQPPFQNNFTTWSPTYFPPSFRMLEGGIVEIGGFGKGGPAITPSYTVVWTLPVGYRPPAERRFTSMHSGNGVVGIQIQRDGFVYIAEAGLPANAWFHLEGIRFQAGPIAARPDAFAAPFPLLVKTSGRFVAKTCEVVQVVDKTDTLGGPIGAATVDWAQDKAGVKLNAIWGLQPGRKYDVTLLLTAG